MKKRQKPIVLITILVVAIVGAVFVNNLNNAPQGPDVPQPPDQETVLGQGRAGSASPKSVAGEVAGKLHGGGGGAAAHPPDEPPMDLAGTITGPSIVAPKHNTYQPKP